MNSAQTEKVPAFMGGSAMVDDRQFRMLFEQMTTPLVVHEIICDEHSAPVDCRFLFANPAFEQITALKVHEIIGKTVLEIIPGITLHWIERFGHVAVTGESCRVLDVYPGWDDPVWMRAFRTEPGRFAVLIEDVTDLKGHLAKQTGIIAELQRKVEEADQVNRLISHDLRSPLHTIRGFADIIYQDLSQGQTKTLLPDMERIIDAGSRMQGMLDEIVAFSRAGKVLGDVGLVNMGELVTDAITAPGSRFGNESVKLVVSDSLPTVRGDRKRLRLLISSLLENALLLLEGRMGPVIEIGFGSTAIGCVFSVRNNGADIPADQLKSVCSFALGSDSEAKRPGLGLAIARRIVEAHGGKLWIESEGRGKGSIVFFSLPDATGDQRTNSLS